VADDLRRSRLTVFFRPLLLLPHVVWLALWGLAALLALVAGWLVGIVASRLPDALHGFLGAFLRYTTHVYAYAWVAANPFPGFTGGPGYPIDLVIAPAGSQSRWTMAFRAFLALPACVVSSLLQLAGSLLALIAWVYALVMGRAIKRVRDVQLSCLRYHTSTTAYLLLLTERYPSFSRD
jgi:uncharacterized protein DUF4389